MGGNVGACIALNLALLDVDSITPEPSHLLGYLEYRGHHPVHLEMLPLVQSLPERCFDPA